MPRKPALDDLPFSDRLAEQLAACVLTADHLELREGYLVDSEQPRIAAWRDGTMTDEERALRTSPFLDQIAATAARGVAVRRLRVVSLPATEYVRYLHGGTGANIAHGEQVRWLDRADAFDLLLPALDYWQFDADALMLHQFDGDGRMTGHAFVEHPAWADRYADAFEHAWDRAVPHNEFKA
jgi:hypothetical protein